MLEREKSGKELSIQSSTVPEQLGVSGVQPRLTKKGELGEATISVVSPSNCERKRPSKTVAGSGYTPLKKYKWRLPQITSNMCFPQLSTLTVVAGH
jgi:hypothetical protein